MNIDDVPTLTRIMESIEALRDIAISEEQKALFMLSMYKDSNKHEKEALIAKSQRIILQKIIDETFPIWEIKWIHTGKYEAIYKIHASSEETAIDYVSNHRLELESSEIIPLSDDYEQYM